MLPWLSVNAKHASEAPVQLRLSGPKSVSAGSPLPLHLRFKNISRNQSVVLNRASRYAYLSWSIHGKDGKSATYRGIEIDDCTAPPEVVNAGSQSEWIVDASQDYEFPGPGLYFFTATYTFHDSGTLGDLKTPRSVSSNTIIITLR